MKELIVILSATWKFAATFPIAVYAFKMSFFETILYTNIGGLLGIIFFTLLSRGLLKVFEALWPQKWRCKKKQHKTFTKRNRRLVILRKKYGLPGIVVLTPVLLSIPVGVFLITKYYGKQKSSYLFLFLGQIVWSFIYTIVLIKIKNAI
jgi:ABC-type antimicrobial peptide transport system permease subunit